MKRVILVIATMLLSFTAMAQHTREVTLFGHRGSRYEFDENTMAAYKGMREKGVNGLETDVRLTKDGELVISHDSSLDRLTPNAGKVEEMTRKQISKVTTDKGNPIAFVDELCLWLSECNGMYVEFEMKTSDYSPEQLKSYCEKLYKVAMARKPINSTYVFTSFDVRVLQTMKQLYPDADLMLIVSKPVSDQVIKQAQQLGVKRIGCNMGGTSRSMVEKAKKEGLIVSLWPGQSIEDFILGVALGADALCSDMAVGVKEFAKKNMPWVDLN